MRGLQRALFPLLLLAMPFFVAAVAASPSISLSVDHGQPGAHVTVAGSNFNPSEPVQILFDATQLNRVSADLQGSFTADVVVPDSTQGTHTICARQRFCANFVVTAPPTPVPTPPPTPPPTPVPTPTPTETPSATPSASASPTPSSIAGISTGGSGGGLLGSLFPGILIPIVLLLAAGGVALYLILRNRAGGGSPPPTHRPGRPPQPLGPPGTRPGQMTVTHRAPAPGGGGPASPSPSGPPAGTPPPPPPPREGPPSGGWGPPTPPPAPPPPPPQGPRPAGGDDLADLPQRDD